MAFTLIKDADTRPIAKCGDTVIYQAPDICVEDALDEEMEKEVLAHLAAMSMKAKARMAYKIASETFNSWEAPRGSKMIPIPNTQLGRELVYVPGVAGSGKSVFCGEYAKGYHYLYPERRVYLISEKEHDEALDDLDYVVRLPLETLKPEEAEEERPGKRKPKLVKKYVDYAAFENSLVIFDDIDAIMDEDLRAGVQALAKSIIHVGRSKQICCVFTCHEHLGGHFTKHIIHGADRIVFFPKRNRIGISSFFSVPAYKGQRGTIMPLVLDGPDPSRPSHWVCYYKHAPTHLITERGIYSVEGA